MIATSGFLTVLECTKILFGRGSALDLAWKFTALPRLPSWFKGVLLLTDVAEKGRKGIEERGERREVK